MKKTADTTAKRTSLTPVASLTVVDSESLDAGKKTSQSRVLVVQRDPRTNATHPDVACVPTQRIPEALFGALTGAPPPTPGDHGHWEVNSEASNNWEQTGFDPAVYVAESILSRKLGLGDALEMERIRFRARTRAVRVGSAFYAGPNPYGPSEEIALVSIELLLDAGVSEVPAQTGSYSHIFWSQLGSFLDAAESNDVAEFGMEIDPLRVCVHGLCVQSTAAVLSRDLVGSQPT